MEMTEHPTRVARQERRSPMSSATPLVTSRNATRDETGYTLFRARLATFSRARLTGQGKKRRHCTLLVPRVLLLFKPYLKLCDLNFKFLPSCVIKHISRSWL